MEHGTIRWPGRGEAPAELERDDLARLRGARVRDVETDDVTMVVGLVAVGAFAGLALALVLWWP